MKLKNNYKKVWLVTLLCLPLYQQNNNVMQLDIQIKGGGTASEIAAALRSIADDVESGTHLQSLTTKGECEWEDSSLFTTITEAIL